MPAPHALAFLPKPVLFGLYGAIGGLLGALVFGEPAWQILQPPPPPPAQSEARVKISASPSLQLIQNKENTFAVEVARAEFDGPVTINVDNLPAGVTASPVEIPKGQTSARVNLKAADGAVAGNTPLKVTASAKVNDRPISDDTGLSLTVVAPPAPQADVVFVLDVTGSMDQFIYGIRDGIKNFAAQMRANRIDFRVGLVAFRDLTNPSDETDHGWKLMQVLDFGGSPFTTDADAFKAEVGKLVAAGGGDTPESSLQGVETACGLDFRRTATKVLLLITDAPPKVTNGQGIYQSDDMELAGAKKTAQLVHDKGIDAVHLVVRNARPRDGGLTDLQIYTPLMEAGLIKGAGQFFDLQETKEAGAAGFTRLLNKFSSSVVESSAAKDPVKPTVADEAVKPVLTATSLQSSQQYAEGSEGRLLFMSSVWTGAVAALVCLLLLAGQHHYLRGALPTNETIAMGVGGGLIVGLLGGACGYGLYLMSPGGAAFNFIFKVFGWSLLGGLAGVGLSLFIPNLKWVYGLAGGAAGGAAGAIGFMIANGIVGSAIGGSMGDIIGRLAGGLIMGFCIGLMVAIVEAAFRRAWLEVRFGERETITVNLGPEPVKIGGDSRACTVWARGAVPIALRYFIRAGEVVCEDAPARSEAIVRNGDQRAVGNVTVTVRTGSSASPAPSGPQARPTMPPPRPVAKPNQADLSTVDPDDLLPMPMPRQSAAPRSPVAAPAAPPRPSAPAVKPPAPVIGAKPPPPAPVIGAKPPPPAPAAPPAVKPAAPKPTAGPRDPDACPSCGRKYPGRPGARYCMVCDQTF